MAAATANIATFEDFRRSRRPGLLPDLPAAIASPPDLPAAIASPRGSRVGVIRQSCMLVRIPTTRLAAPEIRRLIVERSVSTIPRFAAIVEVGSLPGAWCARRLGVGSTLRRARERPPHATTAYRDPARRILSAAAPVMLNAPTTLGRVLCSQCRVVAYAQGDPVRGPRRQQASR